MTLDTGHSSPSAGVKPSSKPKVDKVFTHEVVFGDITIGPFSLDDALEILQISETKFQEQLDSRGFYPAGDFDRNSVFPAG